MMIVDAPTPHPTSATFAPRSSLAVTPSSAGSHDWIRLPRYPDRKNRSVPSNRHGCWWPHSRPAPVLKFAAIFDSPAHIAAVTWNRPGTNAGLSEFASASAASGGNRYVLVSVQYWT